MTNDEFIKAISLKGEQWKDIAEYEGIYMVSSMGRVISLGRRIFHKYRSHKREPILMRPHKIKIRKIIYYVVRLYSDGICSNKTIHRLVAQAFIPNPNNYPHIDHINRDGTDNRIENLRWCTAKMNMCNENTKKILSEVRKGRDVSWCWRPVVRIKDSTLLKQYKNITEATKEGYTANGIVETCNRKQKSHRGYQWMYLSDYEQSKS